MNNSARTRRWPYIVASLPLVAMGIFYLFVAWFRLRSVPGPPTGVLTRASSAVPRSSQTSRSSLCLRPHCSPSSRVRAPWRHRSTTVFAGSAFLARSEYSAGAH
jgi:hypothetical protein